MKHDSELPCKYWDLLKSLILCQFQSFTYQLTSTNIQ
nr:MAG TPA: hypothetical protein [Bacteriophage sp.]